MGRVPTVKIYTRKGDNGSTGLLFGGRVAKDAAPIELNGAVDEAQAVLGLARAEAPPGSELNDIVTRLQHDLYVLMAEVATADANRGKLNPGTTLVTADMVSALEALIDELSARTKMPTEFVLPGENRVSAALDVARTVVRRAERRWVAAAHQQADGSQVGPYLNRLSDLLWTMARWQEGEHHRAARDRMRTATAGDPPAEPGHQGTSGDR